MDPPSELYDADPIPDTGEVRAPGTEDLQSIVLTGLIARMATGEEAALAHLYDLTLARVYSLARRITGRSDLAEEVCVETYWQCWREASRYDAQRGGPLAWLMVMTRSRALDAIRGLDQARSCPDPEILRDLESDLGDPALEGLLEGERAGALHQALATLSQSQRQMVALAFYKDLSHQEISERTGLPLGTVKSHLRRAQDRLRRSLTPARGPS